MNSRVGRDLASNIMLRNHTLRIFQQFSYQARRDLINSSNHAVPTARPNPRFFSSKLATKPSTTPISTPRRSSLCSRPIRQRQTRQQDRPNSNKSTSSRPSESSTLNTTSEAEALKAPDSTLTLSQRMRKLSREYGWSALGVYLGLSALDFPFCFIAVRLLGVDRIGHYEHVIVSTMWNVIGPVWSVISLPLPEGSLGKSNPGEAKEDETAAAKLIAVPAEDEGSGREVAEPGQPMEWSWGVEEAEKAHKQGATIWTQLALAYAIHKSFIFIRVPLTAAVTPKVVRVLRGWGWDIGKRRPKAPK